MINPVFLVLLGEIKAMVKGEEAVGLVALALESPYKH